MVRSRLALAVAATAVVIGGCASVRQTVSGWFGAAPTPTPTSGAAEMGDPFFAAVEGLTVRDGPSASAKVVGRLALHEKVWRTRLERGYAYVTAASGLSGWVVNAQLIWRLPAARGAEAPRAETPGAETPGAPAPAPAAPEAPEGPAAAEPEATGVPAETGAESAPTARPTATAASATRGAPPTPAPAIFDPF